MRITDHLVRLANIWAEVSDRSRATLASKIANDSELFDRLEQGRTCTTATFEKFLLFFRDGANWPDQRVPIEAADLLDNFENIAVEAAASTGQSGNLSRRSEPTT